MNETIRIRAAILTAVTAAPLVVFAWGFTVPLAAQPAPALVVASPAPVALAFARVDDRSISARLAGATRPGIATIEMRSLRDQTVRSVRVDGAVPGGSFILPAPWDGELRITRPAAQGARRETAFVGVVVEPMITMGPGVPPRILYGPGGRASIRFSAGGAPPDGTQVVITSPSISSPAAPAPSVAETVEIGITPAPAGTINAVIGMTPWAPPAGRLAVSVLDRATGRWSELPSHVGRDGTVYATGPVPGVYALTVTR